MSKFRIGQVVKTRQGYPFKVEGPIHKIIQPSPDVVLLWGNSKPRYLIRDSHTGEFVNVIEKELEKV